MLRSLAFHGAAVLACVLAGVLQCSRPALGPTEARGSDTYARMCAVCHGAEGEGYKADRAPALAHEGFLSTVSDDFLRHAIVKGRPGTTMSAWGAERGGPLEASDVQDLVAFMRSWHRGKPRTLDERAPGGDRARGATLYAKECASCHGPDGTRGPNIQIGSREVLAFATNGFFRHAIREGRSGTPMPGFAATLGDQGVEDLLTFLRGIRPPPEPKPSAAAPVRAPPLPLGPVPLNPKGPEPKGFAMAPKGTPADVISRELRRGAKMALLDARAPTDYVHEHISGAVSVPFYDPAPYLNDLPRDAWLVCYCACPHAESKSLAAALVNAGFPKVTVLDEGIGYWRSKGYGVSTGQVP